MVKKVFEAKDLYYDAVNENKSSNKTHIRLIDDVSVRLESGRLTAIMGHNGAGKSTLMDLLIGRVENKSKTSGSLSYCGEEILNPHFWVPKTAFLQQKEEYIKSLTVEEYLRYEVSFYREELSPEEQDKLLINIMTESGIIHKRYEVIEKLSGGETKKTMISSTSLQNAEILFMDEPTSWLDSYNAHCFIKTMKEMAIKRNIIIVIIINQPSQDIFEMFDDLIFLKTGGTVFYSGPIAQLDDFLASKSLIKPDDLQTVNYLFSLENQGGISSEVNHYRSPVRTYPELNEDYYGSGFSKNSISTLIKRRLTYGKAEGDYRVLFILRIIFLVLVSYGFVLDIENSSNYQMSDSTNSYDVERVFSLFEYFSNAVQFITITFLFSPSFYGKNEVLTCEIFLGKYSTYSLFLSAFLYDFTFKLASLFILTYFSLLYDGKYVLTSLWPFIYLAFSLFFISLANLVVSSIKSRVYWLLFSFIFCLFIGNSPEEIRCNEISVSPLFILAYFGFLVNPANFIILIWYKLMSKDSVIAGSSELLKHPTIRFIANKEYEFTERIFGFSCSVFVLFIFFLVSSVASCALFTYIFFKKVSPSIRVKLKK